MKKSLMKLTKKEFNKLKEIGFLWEFYPEAPDTYEALHLTKYSTNELKSKNYLKR